jgi:tetratricopeptide (TPR) repeat protein
MKKTAKPETAEVAQTKQQLFEMTDAFCDTSLNFEYKRLCRKLIERMARKSPPPFLRGRLDLWAAGIVYALGSSNFLFDKSFEPSISASDLCAAFGTKQGSTAQKATQIREMFDLGYMGDAAFLTKEIGKSRASLDQHLLQMAPLLMEDLPEDDPGEPTAPTRHGGEFVDGDHPAIMRFYALAERYEQSGPSPVVQKGLEELIQRDPDFFDSYLMLAEIRAKQGQRAAAGELLETAYQRALTRILDAKGQWPKSLEWGWMENRHIIRTFLNKAIALWTGGETEAALELFSRLLHSNPNDNAGVRWYILAIRLGMTFTGFEKKFGSQYGYDGMKLIEWFDTNIGKFPDDFDWWQKAVGEEND